MVQLDGFLFLIGLVEVLTLGHCGQSLMSVLS